MRKNTKGKCEKFIEKNTGYTLSGGTPFDTVFANNWQKRANVVNQTMQHFGYTVTYGDFSPYLARNVTELAKIIKQYQTPYTQLNKRVCNIFQKVFGIKMQHIIDVRTPLYDDNSIIYMYDPDINSYTFLEFQTELENTFNIKIHNPHQTTKELDTLKKWCDYIASIQGIQIPQRHK